MAYTNAKDSDILSLKSIIDKNWIIKSKIIFLLLRFVIPST